MYFEFAGFSAQCNFLRRRDKRPIAIERRTIDRGEFLDFSPLPPVSSSLLVSPAAGYPAFSKYERVQEKERERGRVGVGGSTRKELDHRNTPVSTTEVPEEEDGYGCRVLRCRVVFAHLVGSSDVICDVECRRRYEIQIRSHGVHTSN